jgi:hypothetical protein
MIHVYDRQRFTARNSSSNSDTKYTIIDINDVFQENMFNFSVSNINKLNMFSAGYQQCKTQL